MKDDGSESRCCWSSSLNSMPTGAMVLRIFDKGILLRSINTKVHEGEEMGR